MGLFDIFKKKEQQLSDWPFADAPDTAAFTNKHVMAGKLITTVYHDVEDSTWQFHTDDPDTNSNSVLMIVGLGEIIAIDSSIAELASLPTGYKATRISRTSSWTIEKHQRSDEN